MLSKKNTKSVDVDMHTELARVLNLPSEASPIDIFVEIGRLQERADNRPANVLSWDSPVGVSICGSAADDDTAINR